MGHYGVDDLKLAFSLHVVDLIVAADDQVDSSELRFIEEHFPPAEMVKRGFANEDGSRTEAYHDAAMEALERLPTELDRAAKLELLTVFFDATVVDDSFELAEGSALLDGARLLELEDEQIQEFLASRSEAGGATLDQLEEG